MKIATSRQSFLCLLSAAGLTVALLGLPTFSRPAQAAPAQASGPLTMGSVDLNKILAGYSKKAAYDQQLQDLIASLNERFKQQENYDMLSKDQQTQLTTLLSKPTPTSQDQAAITQLQAQSNKDAQELTTLQQKPSPTAADAARMQALSQQHAAGQQALKDINDTYAAQVQTKQQQFSAEMSETVHNAIIAVAKERGLSMVFTSEVALYSANEITDEVLKRLNGK